MERDESKVNSIEQTQEVEKKLKNELNNLNNSNDIKKYESEQKTLHVEETAVEHENYTDTKNRINSEENNSLNNEDDFKKPIIFQKPDLNEGKNRPSSSDSLIINTQKPPEPKSLDKNLDYKEPNGSCLPKTTGIDYCFEILKNGSIIETVNLMKQRFWLFGRLESCHIVMHHPTVSRHHAVLQYLGEGNEIGEPGFYLYDLGSTHGTFLNKNRLKPKLHVKIKVGHIIKLGCSTRSYILNGPEEDQEEESELSVTELKQKRVEDMKEAERKKQEEKEKEEARGIDWGLGEDADEEVDLSENPYAQTNNEELFLDDPKKALRGFFEREGLDLQYDCTEHSMGQFLCKVELPLDDEMGRPIIAEVLHKGKKKEAVVQCALEACKILDRHGVLRQANHESRKRKAKNWEENDYYDSDEDTFLDRTGTIEKKREKRKNSAVTDKVETYDSLCQQEKTLTAQIKELEKKLSQVCSKDDKDHKESTEEDSLDAYMNQLTDSKPDKIAINKMKANVTKLKNELSRIRKLINMVKPAELPPLQAQMLDDTTKLKKPVLPMIGKRKTGKVFLPAKPVQQQVPLGIDDGQEEEESDEDTAKDCVKDSGHSKNSVISMDAEDFKT